MRVTANFEQGTVGNNILTSDPGDATPFSSVSGAVGGTSLTYSNSVVLFGTKSAKHTTDGTNFNSQYEWNVSSVPQVYFRGYFCIMTTSSASELVFTATGAGFNWAINADMSAKTIYLRDSTLGTIATSTTHYTVGEWFRMECFAVDNATTGSLTCNLYYAPHSTTISETVSFTNKNTRADTTQVTVGSGSNAIMTYYTDGVEFNDYAYPGPLQPPTIPQISMPAIGASW